jgi:hypothetical protein
MAASANAWEARLAREDLAPLDLRSSDGTVSVARDPGGKPRFKSVVPIGHSDAVDAWTGWAQEVLHTHDFGGKRQRSVWRLYAVGTTLTEITVKLRVSRRAVTRAIERVERKAPPPPCPNPWRKSNRTEPARMNDGQVLALLRHLVTTQLEGDMAGITNRSVTVHYDRIILKGGLTLDVRRARMNSRDRSELVNIDGRPHAGGIDVEIETRDQQNVETITTYTVPWANIKQAERSRIDEKQPAGEEAAAE